MHKKQGVAIFLASIALFLATAVVAFGQSSSVLLPVSDGNYKQLTPKSGTTHYTMVDESSCNGATDYNYTNTVGYRDSYGVNISSVPNGATINSIQITPCASANKAGSSVMNVFYRWNGANSSDAGNYSVSGTTPTAQTATAFNSLSLVKGSASVLEIGAVLSSGTKGLRLGRIAVVVDYTPLSAPSNLAASAVGQSVSLSWTDNSSNELGFQIERSLNASSSFTVIGSTTANVNTYSDNSVSYGTTYYYRLRAFNAGGNSSYSNQASATTLSAPVAPSNLTTHAASSSGSVWMTWTDNSNNETGFKVERSVNGVDFTQVTLNSANNTFYSESGLSDGTYYYRVRAYNAAGDSAYSNVGTFTVQLAPAAPTNLNGMASSSSAYIYWTDNSNNETGFKVERGTDGVNFSEITSVTGAWYSDNNLSAGTYYYRVRAYNTSGYSSYSNVKSIVVVAPPAAPSNLNGMASSSEVYIYWTDNSNNETGFKVERGTDGVNFSEITSVTGAWYSDNGLSAGTYYYRVRAYNAYGYSSYSNVKSIVIAAPPAAPSNLIAMGTSTSVVLLWTDNSSDEFVFRVERGTDGVNFSQIATVSANVNYYSDRNLAAGTYYYRVRASGPSGDSAYSNVASSVIQ